MKKKSKQREFIIIIYSSWPFFSYSFQVQVSGKQNWLTEWQNKHRTVETETYLSYSPPVFASAQAHIGQSYNTTWKHAQQVNLS